MWERFSLSPKNARLSGKGTSVDRSQVCVCVCVCVHACNAVLLTYTFSHVTVPIPTFVLGPCDESQCEFYNNIPFSGGDLCDNLTFLGKSMHDD